MKSLNGNRIAEIQAAEAARTIAQLQKEKAYLLAELEQYCEEERQRASENNAE